MQKQTFKTPGEQNSRVQVANSLNQQPIKILQEDLLFKYEKSKLFFANAEVKRVMEEFISTGKII